ncbi:MAG: DUF4062 domain-containing protein [Agitococcus sp.]|nr:DUF4062 domain-containing protein [Agitococcus sp.]
MQASKTFRLFISSTFSDFKLERQTLHEKVFPVIDLYCTERGCQFQPVDLRWGVSAEAQLDQKTLELCLNEVRACKHFPHPNFLIMLGNRYGWVPLPYAIEKSEFESIKNFCENDTKAGELLSDWYIEDTNHIMETSHAYVLKQRDPKGPYLDWKAWEVLENELRSYLQNAADALFKDTPSYSKYFHSATEAEVEEGIFQYLDATPYQKDLAQKSSELIAIDSEYVYGFIRENTNKTFDISKEPARSFIDADQTKVNEFKNELIGTLNDTNLLTSKVSISNDIDHPFNDEKYLDDFEEFMIRKFKSAVDKQISEAKSISKLVQERSEQLQFKALKIETFFGRKQELGQITDYLEAASIQPLIVHGISGIGKSSFIAKAIDQTEESLTHTVVYRFIGATASSSNIRTLLELLIEELAEENILIKPEAFEQDSNKFNAQIKELFLSIEKPTVLILDALDQLQHNDWLQWLPLDLPNNLKIILSMLDQKNYEHYYDLLKNKINKSNQIEIKPLEIEHAKDTLVSLLEKEKRTLTDIQFKYAINQYVNNDSSPLYLKIAFEEIKTWKSSDLDETLSNERTQGIIKEFIDRLTSKYHHDRIIVHKILGLIAASRDGLSEKEILDLLSRDEMILDSLEKFNKLTLTIDGKQTRRFPISIWARLYEQLKPFTNIRLIDGENLIQFFHRQIDEAVGSYCYEDKKQALHTELSNYFLTLQDETQTWDKRYHNLHMLDELPYHLFHANDSVRLKEILFDLEFAGSIYDHDKQNRFREIIEKATQLAGITQEEIFPWESFYREKGHLIARTNEVLWRPHQSLFQLAYEDGENSPLSKKADELLQSNRINFLWLKNKTPYKHFVRSGLLKPFRAHMDKILGIEVFPDGRILSYAYVADYNICLWNSDGELLALLVGHTHPINGVKILADGRILSYSADETLCLWDSDGNPLAVLKGHTNPVHGVKILPDGRILSYAHDNTIRMWSSEGKFLRGWRWHVDTVQGIEILSDEKCVSYSDDGSLMIWKLNGIRWFYKFFFGKRLGHGGIVNGVKILSDGKILSYSDDHTLCLWDSNGKSLAILNGHAGSVRGAEILPDGKILSYASDDTLRLWDSHGKPLAVLKGHTSSINGVKILPDGSILSYAHDNTMRMWSSEGESVAIYKGHVGFVKGAEILPDGRILSYSDDGTVRLWDCNGETVAIYEGHTAAVNGVKVLSDKEFISYSDDFTLRKWNMEKERSTRLHEHSFNYSIKPKIFPDGRIILFSGSNMKLISNDGDLLATLEGHSSQVVGAELLDDGRIISYSWDETLRLWDSKGKEVSVLEGSSWWRDARVDILTDSKILLSRLEDSRLWDSQGTLLKRFADYWEINTLPDGRLCGIDYNDRIHLFNSNGDLLMNLVGHTKRVRGLIVMQDGRLLSYSDDTTLRIWNSTGETLAILTGHTGRVKGVEILSGGRILSYGDETLRLWDSDGKSLMILKEDGRVTSVQILPEGRFLSDWSLWNSDGTKLGKIDGTCIHALADGRILTYVHNSSDVRFNLWSKEGEHLGLNTIKYKWNTGPNEYFSTYPNEVMITYHDNLSWKLWDFNCSTDSIDFVGNTSGVNGVLLLNNEKILSYSEDGSVRLWDNKGCQESIWYLADDNTNITGVEQNTLVASNHNKLYLYGLYNGNQQVKIDITKRIPLDQIYRTTGS